MTAAPSHIAGMHTFDMKRENLLPINFAYLEQAQLSSTAQHEIHALVEAALNAGPFSVVRDKRLASSGNPHDYSSIAPYFWPNPNTLDGLPWIQRDGEINPERDQGDNNPLFLLCRTLYHLGLGYALWGIRGVNNTSFV